jgi:hypothetical protein
MSPRASDARCPGRRDSWPHRGLGAGGGGRDVANSSGRLARSTAMMTDSCVTMLKRISGTAALLGRVSGAQDRGPSGLRSSATCWQQGAWLRPWTSRAWDPGASASLASYESAGDRLRRTRPCEQVSWPTPCQAPASGRSARRINSSRQTMDAAASRSASLTEHPLDAPHRPSTQRDC